MLSKTRKDHFGWPCSLMFAFLVHALSQITCTLNEKRDTILRAKALMCDSESKQFHLLIKTKTLSNYVSSDSCRH